MTIFQPKFLHSVSIGTHAFVNNSHPILMILQLHITFVGMTSPRRLTYPVDLV